MIVEYDHTLTLVSFTEPDFSGVDRGPGLHQGRTSIPAFQVVILLLFLAFGLDVVVVVVFVVVAVVFVVVAFVFLTLTLVVVFVVAVGVMKLFFLLMFLSF